MSDQRKQLLQRRQLLQMKRDIDRKHKESIAAWELLYESITGQQYKTGDEVVRKAGVPKTRFFRRSRRISYGGMINPVRQIINSDFNGGQEFSSEMVAKELKKLDQFRSIRLRPDLIKKVGSCLANHMDKLGIRRTTVAIPGHRALWAKKV